MSAETMNEADSYDEIWDELRNKGQGIALYPYDTVVSYVFRNRPDKPREETVVMEVGCGAANNLWFAAREGFKVCGLDGCAPVIDIAKERFAAEGLTGDLRVGDFTELPWEDESVDIAIDRGALTCTGLSSAAKSIREVYRVLRPGGKFMFNPYSDRHSSHLSGKRGPDGLTIDITGGTVANTGQVCFYGRRDVESMFDDGWEILSIEHMEQVEQRTTDISVHAEWRAYARKL